MNNIIMGIVTLFYLVSSLSYLLYLLARPKALGIIAILITYLGFGGHTLGIICRWIESYHQGIGHAPFSNLYESLIFFSWAIILTYLVVEARYKLRSLGAFVIPLAFLAMAYASLSPNMVREIQPLAPALQSNWFVPHVITCFLGYAAFTVSFGLAIMYLTSKRRDEKGFLEGLIHNLILIGFPFFSLGIITGAIWANYAWGAWWSWDPKETWSLITWFIYATFLHTRIFRGWRGRNTVLFSFAGFAAILFTYFGVSWILPGLHSYAE